MTETPRTTAGRMMLAAGLTFHSGRRLADFPDLVRDIEAEAAAAERAETRAAWETAKRQFGSRRWLESGDCIAFVDGMLADPVP